MKAADSAATNLHYAFTGEGGPHSQLGQAVSGPIRSALEDALRQAQENAAATSVSAPQTVGPQKTEGPGEASREQVKATDSRSKEGVAEMFRLMRGVDNDVQEKQLDVLIQIHEDLQDGDVTENVMALSGA
jgi:hypothetical protein